ncbi:hypothetical protein [Thermoanaerobacterium thermosaccharolyticum]|uniref:hypothetical protein n=1 Tax=Thermoanaerobacterium thermosaccharolyticum TaxID=1517 RepID=UPI002FD97E0E
MSNKIVKKVRIRCSGHLHEIGLNQKGQLIFFNHTKEELKTEKALCKLGAEPCGCLKFLCKWKKGKLKNKKFIKEVKIIQNKKVFRHKKICPFSKTRIEREMILSKELAYKTFTKAFKEKMLFDLGFSTTIIAIALKTLENKYYTTVYLPYDWWKIYKHYNGGIVDNKIIIYIKKNIEKNSDVCLCQFLNINTIGYYTEKINSPKLKGENKEEELL